MAQEGSDLYGETVSCSICLFLLKEPVIIPCGHSYCKTCINSFWDGEAVKRSYSCPQCREVFTPRPVLVKNTVLAEVVEKIKKSRQHDDPDVESYATSGDVACDSCSGRKLKAFKSCLVCVESYCQKHLQPHHESAAFKKHKLVDPSEKLQEKICSRHGEVMKMFSRTDQKFICYLCSERVEDLEPSEPTSRAGFLEYSQEMTLDPNTAHINLSLSEENRKVTGMIQNQSCPPHPDRFTDYNQVLSRESVTGRSYWEVEWRGGGVYVGVSYKSISRAGIRDESRLGRNNKSWMLECYTNKYIFRHNKIRTEVPGPPSSRIGVYVDRTAGVLSFYSVCDTMTLIHRVSTTFTETLHLGLWVWKDGDTAELCTL